MKKSCCECNQKLSKDEIALTKKIIDADAREFRCLMCLAEHLGCDVEDLKIKIEEFKEQGCTLFM